MAGVQATITCLHLKLDILSEVYYMCFAIGLDFMGAELIGLRDCIKAYLFVVVGLAVCAHRHLYTCTYIEFQ